MTIDFASMQVGDTVILPGTVYQSDWYDQIQAYVATAMEKQFEIVPGWRVIPNEYDENGAPKRERQFTIVRTR